MTKTVQVCHYGAKLRTCTVSDVLRYLSQNIVGLFTQKQINYLGHQPFLLIILTSTKP